MIVRGLRHLKGRPLDRAYLVDALELCLVSALIYARYGWRYADLLTLRIVMSKYKTVSDYIHRDDEDNSLDAEFCRRWDFVGELVDKCMPHLNKYQVACLEAKLIDIAENDNPEKLESDLQRWLHGSK